MMPSLREADELGVSALASRTEGQGLSELDEDAAFEDKNWVTGADRSAINTAKFCRAVNPQCLQILRIDSKQMIDDVITHGT